MARTTDNAVKEVLQQDYDMMNNPSLVPYITASNLLTTRLYNKAVSNNFSPLPTTEELNVIETWLAAHFYVMSDQNYTSRSTADASGSFQGQTGKFLEASKYGQTAILLDPTGLLVVLATQPKASAMSLRCTNLDSCSCED